MNTKLKNVFKTIKDASNNNIWFKAKKLKTADGIKEDKMGLLIPFKDIDNNLIGVQRIRLDKIVSSFNKGFYSINLSDNKIFCDDLAELLTVKLLHPGYQYIYVGRATNLISVAKVFKDKYPNCNYIILANSTNEVEAEEAAEILKAEYKYYSHGYNYVLVNDGLSTVKELLTRGQKLAWAKKYMPSSSEMNAIAKSVSLHENLITSGHVIAIVAPPGAGKTTILMWICSQLPKRLSIYYVNADVSASDSKHYFDQAKEYNISLLLPDLKPELSTEDIYNNLLEMSQSNDDLSNTVFIIDTLKKFTAVINKSESKKFYKLCRSLSGRGMTIILLGHTNKHLDKEGKYIYEGTGDLRSDVDELIYLYPFKEQDGSLTVSTVIDKARCHIEPITFKIEKNRTVSQIGYVDINKQNLKKHDEVCINAVTSAIQSGSTKQIEITRYCSKTYGLGAHKITAILKRYVNDLWLITKGKNNSKIYSLNI